MSYNRKTWTNRNVEYPYRRTLTDTTSGTSQTVDVTRAEGTITTEGDTFDANTMNNMEGRIANEFSLVNQKIGDLNDLDTTDKSSLVDAINEVAAGGGGGGGGTGARYVKISFSSTEPAPSDTARMSYVGTVDHNGTSIAVSQVASLVRSGYEAYLVVAYSNQTIIYPYDGICKVGNDDWLSFEMSNYYQHIRLAVDIDVNNNKMTALVKTKYDAEEIIYDNTTSGLSATDVNSAIDELSASQSTPDAEDVQYDNTNSGLTATDAQAAIDELASEKADLASPAFTGNPTAPTQSKGNDSTRIATTAYVQNELDDINSNFSYDAQASASVPSQTSPFTDIASFSLTAGTWLVIATVNFQSNTSGYRSALISSSSEASGADYRATILVPPVNGDVTRVQVTAILTPTSTTTYYVEAKQNSGSSLSVTARVQRIKLK